MYPLADIISISIIFAFLGPLYAYAILGLQDYLSLSIHVVVLNVIIAGIKKLLGNEGIFGRPAGAKACDLFCVGPAVGGREGMPSGHVATATFLTTAIYLHSDSTTALLLGIPWTISMAWSRWAKNCHNIYQILCGAIVGILFAIAWVQIQRMFQFQRIGD